MNRDRFLDALLIAYLVLGIVVFVLILAVTAIRFVQGS